MKNEWISVKDGLPSEGEDVLAVRKNHIDGTYYVPESVIYEKGVFIGDIPNIDYEKSSRIVTHWQPFKYPIEL